MEPDFQDKPLTSPDTAGKFPNQRPDFPDSGALQTAVTKEPRSENELLLLTVEARHSQ